LSAPAEQLGLIVAFVSSQLQRVSEDEYALLHRTDALSDVREDSGDFSQGSLELAVVRLMRGLQWLDAYGAATAEFHRGLFLADSQIVRLVAVVLAADYLKLKNGVESVQVAALEFCIAACGGASGMHAVAALGTAFLRRQCELDVFVAFIEKFTMVPQGMHEPAFRFARGIAVMMGIVGFAGMVDMRVPIALLMEDVSHIENLIEMTMFADDVAFAATALVRHGGELGTRFGWPVAIALVRGECCSDYVTRELKAAIAQFEMDMVAETIGEY
jgi:hypothetical protein